MLYILELCEFVVACFVLSVTQLSEKINTDINLDNIITLVVNRILSKCLVLFYYSSWRGSCTVCVTSATKLLSTVPGGGIVRLWEVIDLREAGHRANQEQLYLSCWYWIIAVTEGRRTGRWEVIGGRKKRSREECGERPELCAGRKQPSSIVAEKLISSGY